VARINDLNVIFIKQNEIESLGIELYTTGTKIYKQTYLINDDNIEMILKEPQIVKDMNIRIHDYMQTPGVARYIRNRILINKETIQSKNPYTYDNNNVFIHVRLGDVANDSRSKPFDYYDNVLNNLNFDKGYISSDTISDYRCQRLIDKYKLNVFNSDEIDTIKFGSSCKHIVLSLGTFSWYIGAFSFGSNVYFPKIIQKWHGDIFVFPEWNEK
jgi:hypothetical protein